LGQQEVIFKHKGDMIEKYPYNCKIGKGKHIINIRIEKPEDVLQVRKINEQAFKIPDEANIVNKLRNNCSNILSSMPTAGG